MKTQFAIAALTFGAIVIGTNVQAQTVPLSKKGETAVNIELVDLLSITASGANAVNFKYSTALNYSEVQSQKANNLKISSSKPFTVKVVAADTNFHGPTNIEPIPVSIIDITATGEGMSGTKKLSSIEQDLVSGIKGLDQSLDIEYSISAANASTELLGKTAGNYTQTVTYTVTH